MKKLAICLALGATLASSTAMAANQRPTSIAFAAPQQPRTAPAPAAAPAAPKVAKRQKLLEGVPLYIPLVGVVAIAGLITAVSSGSDGSPG